ncbi:bifunctional hydroxymethylpyrimidine kinase/phosphomethylpyrimidine kinase [Aidingimonas halophila]|uniref:hydroxymethylpyrimidine kinase n=1 Tax=Aidingimonas halophila TaxID=574349 RepID=A0A1H2XLS0_9GAMM|nr:hydroxymethylpyrimidine/phosphomethylpyrimidine kinase [Aidingimonas halophila]GHC28938.1 hydroxymethylpyrimidine/phosphomethylpyrimidine kinase [Aidingimonas halophila]SDW93618.1 hydroxymethylpyrimidine/phosphomethylpyrimidine kinase [Aidingimonas halophila]
MPPSTQQLPVVLVLAGHDPSGGAGLIADSETIAASGGWAVTVPTALTAQNTRDVERVFPCRGEDMRAMALALDEFPVAAIKIGLIASLDSLDAVVDIVRRYPGVPLVLDPVLKSGGGTELYTTELIDACRERLLPLVDILTPNRYELAHLADETLDNDTDRAISLLSLGCQAVLVTGTDDPLPVTSTETVMHTLHTPDNGRQWHWPRLPDHYHGSGCTLASSLAARLACGESLIRACEQAQSFTWQALRHGWSPGDGQWLPRRFWNETIRSFSSE